jgi:hypothetical protein
MVTIRVPPRADSFFTVTAWEVETLRHFHRIVEDNLEDLLQRYGVAEGEKLPAGTRVKAEFSLMFLEARIPALFRVPVLTMAWALYEACLVEVSRFFEIKLNLEYSLTTPYREVPERLAKRWQRWNTIHRAKLFYWEELNIPLVSDPADERRLRELLKLRHLLVHSGGRRPPTRQKEWNELARIADRREGLDIETGFVVATADFVRNQIDLVERSTNHIVLAARMIVTECELYE